MQFHSPLGLLIKSGTKWDGALKKLLRKLKYLSWAVNGYLGRRVRSTHPGNVTVLLTYFNPLRARDINFQIRNILKCAFVAEVVLSSHNPDLHIEKLVKVRDRRLKIMTQETKRACGYRWRIAADLSYEYLIVIDDDILLFPGQLKILFEGMLKRPGVPHGLSGMLLMEDGGYEFYERKNMQVNILCEVYGVTNDHVTRYFEMERLLAEKDESLPEAVEKLGDYILISRTSNENPIIHNAGVIFRSETFDSPEVANHKNEQFLQVLEYVTKAVGKISLDV